MIFNQYAFKVSRSGDFSFFIEYEGKINHPLKQIGEEYARGFSETPGIICKKGIYLSGSSYWIPWFNQGLITFKIETVLPAGWVSVSQGRRTKSESNKKESVSVWESPEPMDEAYLIAGEFKEFSSRQGDIDIFAFLRSRDIAMANQYLKTTGQYLKLYEELIGPFPYSKFALIENFWETGYGMPSFTLLGPKVIRFPFILHSSYPHELLHNYWGNSVFVNHESGNWCEGITVYMADHLIKEQREQGTHYRRTTLQGYTDYVNKDNDFPLTAFRSRFDSASSSIGYGKSMMLFHMLRLKFGDKLFLKSIQDFYRANKFSRATFGDIKKSFERITRTDLSGYFKQWVTRKGAPTLKLSDVFLKKLEKGYSLNFVLHQVQAEDDVYALDIPVYLYIRGEKQVVTKTVQMKAKKQQFTIICKKEPVKIDIDSGFDVFRRLSEGEIPPVLSKAFGSSKVVIVLPTDEKTGMINGYKGFALNWSRSNKEKFDILMDNEIAGLPPDRAVWLLGSKNRFKGVIDNSIKKYNSNFSKDLFTVENKKASIHKNSIIIAVKNPMNASQVVVYLSTDNTKALPGLGRKLPHYGKYSYLGFEGEEPTNVLKGQWTILKSPLTSILDQGFEPSFYEFPKRIPLGKIANEFSREALLKHIHFLADKKLMGRGIGTEEIDIAADYIAGKFLEYGLQPGAKNNSFFMDWDQTIKSKTYRLRNVIGIIRGNSSKIKNNPVIVCAHYDHLGKGDGRFKPEYEGKIFPGADDNASGVSVLLELASYISKNHKPKRPVIFIAFSGEESGLLGSRYYVKNYQKFPAENTHTVINLDTVGRLHENQPMVIGGSSAREWKFIFLGIEYTTGIKIILVKEDLDSSDQKSFIKSGVPGIQLFSGPNTDYHKPSDTIDKIDPAGMVKMITVAKEVLVYLMDREESLTFTGSTEKNPVQTSGKERKVKIGIMPDFSYSGKGVKVGLVMDQTPAQRAGLKKGDIIIKVGDKAVNSLREYSEFLKAYKPGDTVVIGYIRSLKRREVVIQFSEK
ncbi:MAG: M20/M25/M40 family metallo-hydrolase [Candidatus Aminicenantes bacterium]|nr:M20/M25/M40 family metallo-hydrolase [Candidatus Aminicenantes bacterium]